MALPWIRRKSQSPPGWRRMRPAAGTLATTSATVLSTVAVIVLLYGGLVVLLWRLRLFDFDATQSDARVIAAALALTGGLVTASLAFVGVLLKHSLDRRNLMLAEEGEARLKLETSIKAVELLTVENGEPASQSRQAGSLFVLASLGQLEFALALLREIWPQDGVSAGAATQVIDRALRSGDGWVQAVAADLLLDNAERLPDPTGAWFAFPSCAELDWPVSADYHARTGLLTALIAVVGSRPLAGWSDGLLAWMAVSLDLIRRIESNDTLRANAVLALHAVLEDRRFEPGDVLHVGERPLNVDEMRAEINGLVADARRTGTLKVLELVERIG